MSTTNFRLRINGDTYFGSYSNIQHSHVWESEKEKKKAPGNELMHLFKAEKLNTTEIPSYVNAFTSVSSQALTFPTGMANDGDFQIEQINKKHNNFTSIRSNKLKWRFVIGS